MCASLIRMSRHITRLILVCLTLAVPSAVACANRTVKPPETIAPENDEELRRIAAAVSKALTSKAPRGYARIPKGVQLLGIERRQDGSIALNLSNELLVRSDEKTLEDALHQILTAAADARGPGTGGDASFTVLINGAMLDAYRP